MPSIKDLKKRIVSVKNTQQTTKAMKMVSAAKLRRAQEAIYCQKPYSIELNGILKTLIQGVPAGSKGFSKEFGRFFERPSDEAAADRPKKVLAVVVTSDRGLCGAFNSSIVRLASKYKSDNSGVDLTFSFLGKKGYDLLKGRTDKIGKYFSEFSGKVTYQKASQLAEHLIASYVSGEFDEIYFIYNEFKNAVTQKATTERFLPVALPVAEESSSSRQVLTAPRPQVILEGLVSKVFKGFVYRIMLESQAGEHGARMAAMENATKNAGDMIRKLNLQYNKQRQAAITKELLEIISGSESQKQA